MADHSTYIEPTAGGLVLTNAILLYQRQRGMPVAADGGAAFASMHPVAMEGSAPVVGAGAPLTHNDVRYWTQALSRSAKPEILPGNVIVAHKDILAWWTPAQVRTAYFALSSPPRDLQALAGRTSVPVPYPAHLFVATRRTLGVYALAKNERPTAETTLLCSPILNVFANGTLCWGNIPRPKGMTVAAIPEYESAVFDSWSTHPNPGQERSVKGKGGLVRLWDDLAARRAKRFPAGRLRPFVPTDARKGRAAATLTLGALIEGAARS